MNPDKAGKQAAKMREKAMAIAMKRKEEYLGARVPKALKDRVIQKADDMNIPVSLLIRRVLEEAFGDDNESRTNEWSFLKSGTAETEKPRTDKFADIIGWKNIEVNQDRSCERCRDPLPKGSEADLGFSESESGYVIVCHQCKSQLLNT